VLAKATASGAVYREVVARILAAHYSGDPPNRIAKNVDVHHSAVSRVIDAAAAHRQRTLAAV
jgi:hypothetical protein